MPVVLVVSKNEFDFPDKEDATRRVTGANAYIIDGNESDSEGRSGCEPAKIKVLPRAAKSLATVPGFYDIGYDVKPGAGGKVTVAIASAKLLEAFDLTAQFDRLAA